MMLMAQAQCPKLAPWGPMEGVHVETFAASSSQKFWQARSNSCGTSDLRPGFKSQRNLSHGSVV